MMLDYMYLLLIFLLLLAIIFLIYLSYEYRSNNLNSIEKFTISINQSDSFNPYEQLSQEYQKELNNFVSKYSELTLNTYNRQKQSDNMAINSILYNMPNNRTNLYSAINKLAIINQEKDKFPVDKVIKTIKSNYNSQYLSLVLNDPTKYGIIVNDKCLTVSDSCPGGTGICVKPCNKGIYTTDTQKFYTNRINNKYNASEMMGLSSDRINSKNVYPFNIFRSSVNDKCLAINNDGLTLEDCNLNSLQQQWAISPDENICKLS
jgi:hypothetical protein